MPSLTILKLIFITKLVFQWLLFCLSVFEILYKYFNVFLSESHSQRNKEKVSAFQKTFPSELFENSVPEVWYTESSVSVLSISRWKRLSKPNHCLTVIHLWFFLRFCIHWTKLLQSFFLYFCIRIDSELVLLLCQTYSLFESKKPLKVSDVKSFSTNVFHNFRAFSNFTNNIVSDFQSKF